MAFIDALVYDPFMVNEQLVDSLLQEPDSFEVWLALRTDGQRGSGTVSDPFDATLAATFDSLMGSFAPYTTIHLAAGTYQTNGYAAGVTGGWQPKRGQRIVGAGIDVTTLKLTPGGTVGALYFAIGADDSVQVNEFEASDMTIDCNLASQAAAVAAGAIKV